ncbi:MAG: hypothetical protein ACE5KM_00470 [Planctomycetaceae bacterium]
MLSRRDLLAASPLLLTPCGLLAANGVPSKRRPKGPGFDEFTPKSRRAIRRGTAWLLKTLGRKGAAGVDIGQPADIGCTSMVGLALMSQGNTPMEGKYYARVRAIRQYLLKAVDNMPSDDITSSTRTQLQNKIGRHAHSFFAALFLSQVIGEGDDPGLIQKRLSKLSGVIVKQQSSRGDWGNSSWAPTLGTVMGWVCLRACHFAGFRVEASAKKTAEHLKQVMQGRIGARRSSGWMHTLYKNATGVRVLYAMGEEKSAIATKAFTDVLSFVKRDHTPFSQAGGEEYLAFQLITDTMLQKGGEGWKQWFPVVRDKICAVQNADGSWQGKHCITSRTFCTAAALMVLTSPNRYLPIAQQ